jgi:hypothetical protein
MASPLSHAFEAGFGSYTGKYTTFLSIVGSAVTFLDLSRFIYQPRSAGPGQLLAPVLH